jgi:Rap1a immunity proteins
MRIGRWSLGLAGCGMVLTAFAARAAVTQDNFLIRNTGDLVAICSAPQTDPLYTAAVNFCHGFGVGVVRALQEEDAASRSRRMFCFPDPAPTRNEAVARFVQWASADPSRLQMPAEDAIATYLSQQYSCPRGR